MTGKGEVRFSGVGEDRSRRQGMQGQQESFPTGAVSRGVEGGGLTKAEVGAGRQSLKVGRGKEVPPLLAAVL